MKLFVIVNNYGLLNLLKASNYLNTIWKLKLPFNVNMNHQSETHNKALRENMNSLNVTYLSSFVSKADMQMLPRS